MYGFIYLYPRVHCLYINSWLEMKINNKEFPLIYRRTSKFLFYILWGHQTSVARWLSDHVSCNTDVYKSVNHGSVIMVVVLFMSTSQTSVTQWSWWLYYWCLQVSQPWLSDHGSCTIYVYKSNIRDSVTMVVVLLMSTSQSSVTQWPC